MPGSDVVMLMLCVWFSAFVEYGGGDVFFRAGGVAWGCCRWVWWGGGWFLRVVGSCARVGGGGGEVGWRVGDGRGAA